MIFSIDSASCVACLACVRVCPADAVAVEDPRVRIIDQACIKCGLCVPACPHDAIEVSGELGRAIAVAARERGVLILSPEAAAHFYPATPEQVVNACYAAGFRSVTRGVIGDELVAAEYLKLRQFLAGRQFPARFATSNSFYAGVLKMFKHIAPLTRFLNEPLLEAGVPTISKSCDRLSRTGAAGRRP